MKYFIEIRDFLYYNRKTILIITGAILSIFLFFFFYNRGYDSKDFNTIDFINEIEQVDTDNEMSSLSIVVDIKGKVKTPGTYEVTSDMRVIDVIKMAGGLLEDGDVSNINLSKKVVDEMVIYIPSINDKNINDKSISYIDDNTNKNNSENSKVSINTGKVEELMTIKGIGETKAKAIIEYRAQNGNFKNIEEVINVKGIGNSTFEKIKDYIKL